MDKQQFCDNMESKFRDLDRFFQLQKNVAPATAEKSFQLEKQRPRREEARTRAEALRQRVTAACSGAGALPNAERGQIEQELAAVMELLK